MAVMIRDYIEGDTAISYEDGRKCLQKELDELKDHEQVTLDFSGVEFVITAFLNPVIGDLILQNGKDIMKKVVIKNANPSIIQKIKMVKDGALLKREDIE